MEESVNDFSVPSRHRKDRSVGLLLDGSVNKAGPSAKEPILSRDLAISALYHSKKDLLWKHRVCDE